VLLVRLGHKVTRATRAILARRVAKVFKALKVILVTLAQRVLPALKVQQGLRVLLAHKGQLVRLVLQVLALLLVVQPVRFFQKLMALTTTLSGQLLVRSP
jgi:hypothetical protein